MTDDRRKRQAGAQEELRIKRRQRRTRHDQPQWTSIRTGSLSQIFGSSADRAPARGGCPAKARLTAKLYAIAKEYEKAAATASLRSVTQKKRLGEHGQQARCCRRTGAAQSVLRCYE